MKSTNGRRRLALALLLCLTAIVLPAKVFAASERPNLLFFFTDDQRNDTLGCAGHDIVKTPNIDQLAQKGVRFENAFVTTSICWVSRATVLTGRWNRSHGEPSQIDKVTAEAASKIFPKLLQEAGYRNGFFGKWHARMPRGFQQQQYFDRYENIHRNPYHKKLPGGGTRHETELIGDRAVEFLESQPGDSPFCLLLWFNAAHAEDGDKRPGVGHFPWPKSVDGLYDDLKMPAPRLGDPAIYESQPDFLKRSLNRTRYFWRWDTPEKYQINLRAYFRMISGIDRVVERVMGVVKERGFAENTVVFYSADNGYYMGDRGFAGKWSHYEQSIRVPMIVYDPRPSANRTRGQVDSRMVLNVDLPATFLELAGVAVPKTYEGRSMVGLIHGNQADSDWREDFFGEFLIRGGVLPIWEGVRGKRYMYAKYLESGFEFLHDLETDPDQLKNFAKDSEYAEVLESMRCRSRQLQAGYGGPFHLPKRQ